MEVNKLHRMTLVIHEVRQNELMLPSGLEIKLFRKQNFILQLLSC